MYPLSNSRHLSPFHSLQLPFSLYALTLMMSVGEAVTSACVQCPCKGWDGKSCYCVRNGCCCTDLPANCIRLTKHGKVCW